MKILLIGATGTLGSRILQEAVSRRVVGGAGSLEVAPGVQLMDMPGFPEAYKAEALQQREALDVVRASGIDWTYLSPVAEISPGERTDHYRTGGDWLLTDAEDRSFVSAEDYAVAVLDEL